MPLASFAPTGLLRRLAQLVDRRDRIRVYLLLGLMIVTALINTFGVASVMPFLSVLSNPDVVHENRWLSWTYQTLGFQDTRGFVFFLGVAAFVVFMLGTALQAGSQWAITRFSHMQQYRLSERLMADYLRRPYSFYLGRNSSDLAKTVLEETRQVINGALLPALRLVQQGLLGVTVIVLLVVVQPWLALTAVVTLGSIYGAIYFSARRWLDRIGKIRVAANRQRFAAAAEAFAGAKEIRLLGRERTYLRRYQGPAHRFAKHQANVVVLSDLPRYAIEAVAFGGVILMVLYLMSAEGGVGAAMPLIGLYAMAARKVIPAYQGIFAAVARLRFATPAVDHLLGDLGDRPGSLPLPSDASRPTPLKCEQSIQFHNITFTYTGAETPALHNLNLSFPAHKTVGIVGSSGAGKSTLVDLLLGLLTPEEGEILIDGTPLAHTNLRNWQATLGYVPQHIFLADDSVAANIALGVPTHDIDMSKVKEAAELANLHSFVTQELPLGYDTQIGERGVRLSGGQRQRIGIARALYRDPSVLVFDEATSALDNETEQMVMDAVYNLTGDKTVILIAHRLSTVKPCERIFVMDAGCLVANGTWDELLRHSIHFQRLAQRSTDQQADSTFTRGADASSEPFQEIPISSRTRTGNN